MPILQSTTLTLCSLLHMLFQALQRRTDVLFGVSGEQSRGQLWSFAWDKKRSREMSLGYKNEGDETRSYLK